MSFRTSEPPNCLPYLLYQRNGVGVWHPKGTGAIGNGVSAKGGEADPNAFSKQTKDDAKEAAEERKIAKPMMARKESCFAFDGRFFTIGN